MFNAHTKLATKISLLLAAGITSAAFALQAGAADLAHTPATYGAAVPAASGDRIITLTPTTKWVNVTDGETVTFVKDGLRFTWQFNTLSGVASVPLSTIAPPSLMVGTVAVYVDSNPLYRN